MNQLFKNTIDSYKHIPYTMKHKLAVLKVERQCIGKTSLRILLHDMDKVLLYLIFPFLGSKKIGAIHKKISRHHHYSKDSNPTEKDLQEMIFDWESARFTKSDKPQSAREFALSSKSHLFNRLSKYLDSWNL